MVNDSKYKENQVPSYSDYYFKYDASGADGFIADVRQACQAANVKIAFAPTGMSFWDIFCPYPLCLLCNLCFLDALQNA